MKQLKLLQEIMEKHKQREYNKPKYKIEDLYVGDIVLLEDFDFKDMITTRYYFKPIKEYAIFKWEKHNKYTHIKSGQGLHLITKAELNDYAINNIVPLNSAFVRVLREHHIAPGSKISLALINRLEDELNKKFNPKQTTTNIFS